MAENIAMSETTKRKTRTSRELQ